MTDSLLHQIALTLLPQVGPVTAKLLVSYCGSAENVFRATRRELLRIPGIGPAVADNLRAPAPLQQAEKELAFLERHEVEALFYTDHRYPAMIIRGGENVYPREVEEFLYGHPDIADVQVIGVPSERYGEEIMAWVRLREGARTTDDALTAYCRGKIATYKIPRFWKIVDGFPMTVTGKIQKYRMREIAVEELGLQAAASIRTA